MTLLSDIRLAVRGLLHVPAFTAAAVVSLTLGIATSAVVFGLVDAALLRPLPFAGSDRLMMLNITQTGPTEGEQRQRWSWQRFLLLRENVTSFADIASHSNVVLTLTGVAEPAPVPVEIVSSRYLTMLQAPLVMGVDFSASDRGSRCSALGRPLQRPLASTIQRRNERHRTRGVAQWNSLHHLRCRRPWLQWAFGTRPGVDPSVGRVRRQLSRVSDHQSEFHFGHRQAAAGRQRRRCTGGGAFDGRTDPRGSSQRGRSQPTIDLPATVMPINEARIDVVTRRGLLMLAGAVIVLLLIACANVASLLLGPRRGTPARDRDSRRLSAPAAVGSCASYSSTALCWLCVSSFFALIVAAWSLSAVRIPATLARGRNFFGALGEFATPTLDWRVISFVVLVGALTTLIFGLVPALRTTRATSPAI